MAELWNDDKHGEEDDGLWFGLDGEELDPSDPFRQRVEAFERYAHDELGFPGVFDELGFTFVDDGCDGTCPQCARKETCAVYPELKAEWDELE